MPATYDPQHLDYRVCEKCGHVARHEFCVTPYLSHGCPACGSEFTRKLRESEVEEAFVARAILVWRGWSVYKELQGWSVSSGARSEPFFIKGFPDIDDPFKVILAAEAWYITTVEPKI